MELALWCDMRVMAASAYMGVYCRRWGVPLIDGGTVRLPRLVGEGRARDIILTGRKVTADECYRIGLCERLAPDGEARRVAEDLAQELARLPQICLRADRRSIGLQDGKSEREALRLDTRIRSASSRRRAAPARREFQRGRDGMARGGTTPHPEGRSARSASRTMGKYSSICAGPRTSWCAFAGGKLHLHVSTSVNFASSAGAAPKCLPRGSRPAIEHGHKEAPPSLPQTASFASSGNYRIKAGLSLSPNQRHKVIKRSNSLSAQGWLPA
jgi:hypothetical protein